MSFAEFQLHPLLLRNLAQMRFREPRAIQAQAIGPMLEGRDVIGLAPTGTGKTAAFIVPIAHHLLDAKPDKKAVRRKPDPMARLRALVLCPTRELAQQVQKDAGLMCQGTVLRTAVAYGKVAISPQARAIAGGIDILIATPGRVRELLEAGSLSLARVSRLAIDEADRMLDLGFMPQVSAILEAIPSQRQIALFSATMPTEVAQLATRFLRNPVRIDIEEHSRPASHIEQRLLSVDEQEKTPLLMHVIAGEGSVKPRRGVLVFCRTKRRVGWVGAALARHGFEVGVIHGDRTQAQRNRTLDGFTSGKIGVVIATDVAARGLHIPTVHTVVNYDLPVASAPEEYIHRVGRAGHGGSRGTLAEAVTFLDPRDKDRWRAIARAVHVDLTAEKPAGFDPEKWGGPRKKAATKTATKTKTKTKTMAEAGAGRAMRSAQKPRRSRKSRPVRKGEKPGGGVKRSAD